MSKIKYSLSNRVTLLTERIFWDCGERRALEGYLETRDRQVNEILFAEPTDLHLV